MADATESYEGPQDAAEAFESANWNRVLPELLKYAKVCLNKQGFHERATRRASAIESEELVNEAVEALLSGERTWIPANAKTERALIAVICMTMRSIAGNVRTNAAVKLRMRSDKAEKKLGRLATETPNAEEQLIANELLLEVKEAVAHDEEIVALVGAYADGKVKRDEIAKSLGWTTVQRVKVVQNRMRTLLRSKGIAFRDPDEDDESERTES